MRITKKNVIGVHPTPFEGKEFMQLALNNLTMRDMYGYNQEIFKAVIRLIELKKVSID